MAVAARKLARPDAADRVADACVALGARPMKHKVKRVHFVGIGGAGMSGIAEVLATQGYRVSGSDLAASKVTARLAKLGVAVEIGHAPANVAGRRRRRRVDCGRAGQSGGRGGARKGDTDRAARADARRADAPEAGHRDRRHARQDDDDDRSSRRCSPKAASIRRSSSADGSFPPDANARLGKGDFLVAEADESDASFLYLSPALAVITNIDADHMETYGHDFERLKRAFVDFAQRLPFYGVAVLCIDDPTVREILPSITKPIVTYGLTADARIHADDIANVGGRMRFVAHAAGLPDLDVELNLPGAHNVQNALAAIAVGREVGVADAAIAKALAEFRGVDRRFQRHGEVHVDGGGTTR